MRRFSLSGFRRSELLRDLDRSVREKGHPLFLRIQIFSIGLLFVPVTISVTKSNHILQPKN